MSMKEFSHGDFPANPLEKEGYRLEFNDELDGPEIDTSKWFPFYLPHFRFSSACVVREAQKNVRKYTPQYGYFELRAKGLNTSANHVSLWMIGYGDSPEKSGEIAIIELLGSQAGPESSGIRFGVHPWSDPNPQDEFYEDFLNIDSSRYHIYGLEWTPTHLDFYVDNRKIKMIHQSPGYPMQFMLGIYEHPFEGAWTGEYDPKAPYPKKFTIDYFRAYQPNGGYIR